MTETGVAQAGITEAGGRTLPDRSPEGARGSMALPGTATASLSVARPGTGFVADAGHLSGRGADRPAPLQRLLDGRPALAQPPPSVPPYSITDPARPRPPPEKIQVFQVSGPAHEEQGAALGVGCIAAPSSSVAPRLPSRTPASVPPDRRRR
ncbi:hypothetical protein [Streptomyces europaeiscabiei]|uniref:hypothetical protein n=1 Tax=Streptomyces europaeiscabiei TaxID=146819 RepID=UPI0029B9EA36|nr:hypothetical protein [Streptomyces europaeiscabiei]MDX2528991.1 hypothetical protein [Streptomyces europaeiscabiei]